MEHHLCVAITAGSKKLLDASTALLYTKFVFSIYPPPGFELAIYIRVALSVALSVAD